MLEETLLIGRLLEASYHPSYMFSPSTPRPFSYRIWNYLVVGPIVIWFLMRCYL